MRLGLFDPFRYIGLAIRRSSTDATLLVGVGSAVLIATTVIGGAPAYLASLDRVAVRSTIDDASLVGRNVMVVNDADVQVRMPVVDAYTANVEAALEEQLGDVSGPMRQVILPPHHARVVDPDAPPLTVQDFTAIRFQYVEGAEDHITYVEGRAPERIDDPAPGDPVIEVGLWVDHILVEIDRIAVGEEFIARTTRGPGETVKFKLTGLFQVHDSNEEFWMNRARALIRPDPIDGFFGPVPGFFINRQALERIAEAGPYGRMTASWILPVNSSEIRELDAAAISRRVDGLYGVMQSSAPGSTVVTGLGNSFDSLARRLAFSRIPMALMATLLIVFVAYYLYMTARALAERRQSEMGVLQSRGGSLGQIGRLYGVEGLVVVGIPVLAGPLLALVLIAQAGRLPLFDEVTGGEPLPVTLDWPGYALSAGAGLVAFAILISPVITFGHGSVVAGKRLEARPDDTPFMHRYFLDFAMLAGAGYLAWELDLRGGVPVTVSDAGEISTDNAILFLPALLLVSVSLVFLRLFPLAMRLTARLAVPIAPAWMALALWRLARSPYSYAAIVVFLMLAAGMVTVAGTLSSTLRESAEDQADYEVGADVRLRMAVEERNAAPSVDEFLAPAFSVDGVVDASAVLRSRGDLPGSFGGPGFEVLGVQPDRFNEVATFRSDFSQSSLSEMMNQIEVTGRAEPILLPPNASKIGAWVQTDEMIPNLFLWARIRTADRIVTTVTLGAIEAGPWRLQTGSLDGLQGPVELLGLHVFEGPGGGTGTPAVIFIDDISGITDAQDGSGAGHVVESFDNQGSWRTLPTNRGNDSTLGLFRGEERGVVARVELGRGTNAGVRGMHRPDIDGPIPVVVSDRLAEMVPLEVGTPRVVTLAGSLVDVLPVATAELFPTMTPDLSAGFLVVDLEAISRYSDAAGGAIATDMNEIFASIEEEGEAETLAALGAAFPSLVSLDHRRSVIEESLVDPLAVAGWRGVGLLGGVIALLVVLAGYLTYLGAYARRMRLQEALLRSIGVSTSEFSRMLVIEHWLVGFAGVAMGTLAGLAMSRIAVSASVRTADGDEVLPPFNILTEWLPVSVFFLTLLTAAVIGVAGMVMAFRRERLHEATRLEA